MSESVFPPATPVPPCIPGLAKRRLGLEELDKDRGPRVYPFPTISTTTHDALVKRFMDNQKKSLAKKECKALLGGGGLVDILQLLKEQSQNMERLGIAL